MNQEIIHQNWFEYIRTSVDLSSAVLVYSPTTKKRFPGIEASVDFCISSHVAFDGLEASISNSQISSKIVIGVGGGTAIDKAKFIAKKMELRCIAVPSMLSTNAFATDKIAYIDRKGVKSTIEGVLPDIVIYDEELIGNDNKYSIYGLADALSSLTALRDWELADEAGVEPIDKECYVRSALMLMKGKQIIKNKQFRNEDIFKVLLEAGYVTNKYGSGRPESGSEHIIAKAVEKRAHIPHAVAVSFGLLIISQFYDCFDEVVSLIKGIGIFDEIARLPYGILKQSLVELTPREDRYTIIDTLPENSLTPSNVEKYLRRMYAAFGINEGAVIFDLDGVLWDSVAEVQEAYKKSLDVPEATLRKFMGKQFSHLAEALNVSPDVLASIQVKEIAYLMENPGKIYDGVKEVLETLKESGRKLFIVSNCQKGYINTFLENYGLSGYFTDWRYDTNRYEYPKLHNIQDLKHKYNLMRPVYVGDTQGDYISATNALTDFIAVDYGFGEITGEFMIGRIGNIKELLEILEKRV